jgi:hypothetical protein
MFNRKPITPSLTEKEIADIVSKELEKQEFSLKREFAREKEEIERNNKIAIEDLNIKKGREIDVLTFKQNQEKKELEYKIEQLKEEASLSRKTQDSLTEAKIAEMVLEYRVKAETATAQNAILRTAFETMGFDVKDMKGILDKLVDGLISKNEINVIR